MSRQSGNQFANIKEVAVCDQLDKIAMDTPVPAKTEVNTVALTKKCQKLEKMNKKLWKFLLEIEEIGEITNKHANLDDRLYVATCAAKNYWRKMKCANLQLNRHIPASEIGYNFLKGIGKVQGKPPVNKPKNMSVAPRTNSRRYANFNRNGNNQAISKATSTATKTGIEVQGPAIQVDDTKPLDLSIRKSSSSHVFGSVTFGIKKPSAAAQGNSTQSTDNIFCYKTKSASDSGSSWARNINEMERQTFASLSSKSTTKPNFSQPKMESLKQQPISLPPGVQQFE